MAPPVSETVKAMLNNMASAQENPLVKPVKKTAPGPYFEDVAHSDLQSVELLNYHEAAAVWMQFFDHRATGLYDLPSELWAVRGPWLPIGICYDVYSCMGDKHKIADLVVSSSKWPLNEPLLLFHNRQQVVALKLQDLHNCWQGLLAAFDDGPILISMRTGGNVAIRFVPWGQVMLTAKS